MPPLTVTVVAITAVVGLVVLSAFFSSSEIAIFSLSDDRLAEQGPSDDRRLPVLRELRDDPHRLLVTILVGNNIVNVAIASIISVLVSVHLSPGAAITVATVLASFVVLVFGEIVPKSYGLGHAQTWALTVARPIALVERLLSPLVTVFDALTRVINDRIGGEVRLEKP